ncbi:hypothetical protein Tco_0830478 [Tanacetum coccineum]
MLLELITYLTQCLGRKIGGLDQISNKDATILYCLANGVKVDYAKKIWEDIINKLNKKTRENVVPYPRFISLLLEYMIPDYDNEELTINPTQVFSIHNWALKPKQTERPLFTDHMKAICNLDVHVDSKALKPSSQTEEESKSKTGQSEKETLSSSAKEKSPSHPSPPTLVVGEMHKETQQAAGGPTSLWATSEEGAHPQLNSGTNPSVLVYQTKSAEDGLKTAHADSGTNEESKPDEISKKIKLEDLLDLFKDMRYAFFTLNSLQDEPIIISDKSEEKEVENLKLNCLPNALKELPSKFTEFSGDSKEIKKHVAELKNIEWELPAEFQVLPSQVSLVQEKFKTLDSLPSLLNKVTDTLNRFATMVKNTSGAARNNVPSVGQASTSLAEGEKHHQGC